MKNEEKIEELQSDLDSFKESHRKEILELENVISQLRSSEVIYRTAYMTSPDAININRVSDGMYVSVNEGFINIMGYSESDTIGRTSLEMNIWVNPQDRVNLIHRLEEKGNARNFEAKFRAKNGRIVYGLMSATMIQLDGVPHMLSIVRDITIRKKAESDLAKEQFLINALMNNLSDHVYFKDLESKFIRTNRSHALSFGLDDPDQVIGKSDFDFFMEQAARQAYEDEQSIIKSGIPILKEEKLTRKDRSDAWFSAIKMPLRNKEGNIIGTFGISRDITARKRSEFESLALFEITKGITTTNNLDELLKLIHHAIGKVVYAENCFVALFDKKTGFFSFPYFVDMVDTKPLPNTLGKSCTAHVFRTVKPLLLIQQVFDELVESGEVELIGSNSPSWIGIPLQTPSEVIGVLGLQHYTKVNVYSENDVKFLSSIGSQVALAIERKKAEEEINLKNEQLLLINAEKDKFFSIIAHDLRGPLSAFIGVTQILTEEIQTMGTDEIREITMSMKASASNIYSLLENLLEWSRLKRGGLDFIGEEINLSKIVNDCVEVLSESAIKKEIRVSVSISEMIEVYADKHMLATAIRNLISNAIKFSNIGGQVLLSAEYKSEDCVEVKVTDTGIGMSSELKNKLFMMNEKTSRNGTDGELSTGLGLLLCKEFIDQLGGKISVESEDGKGSTFFFTLKVHPT